MKSERKRSKQFRRKDLRQSGPAQKKIGRPAGTFKDADTEKLIRNIARGTPIAVACAAAGIHKDTFNAWLDQRPEFAQALAAEKQRIILDWIAIVAAGEKGRDWRGAAFLLERVFPESFAAKPQLAFGVQQNNFTITVEKAREIEEMRATLLPKVNARLGLTNGESINGAETTN